MEADMTMMRAGTRKSPIRAGTRKSPIAQWLERHIKSIKQAIEYNNEDPVMIENFQFILTWLQADLEHERQHPSPDWQMECEEWRRGVGEFMDWLTPLCQERDVLFMPREIYVHVYRTLQERCPQASINWNAELTSEEIEHVKKLAQEYGLK
jgi:hypothetical protein